MACKLLVDIGMCRLRMWMDHKQDGLGTNIAAKDDVTGVTVDVSVTGYADDVKELNMVRDADEAAEVIARSGAILDGIISDVKMKQNSSKAEHVACFFGKGQDSNTKALHAKLIEHGLGELKGCARYLGAWLRHDGSPATCVQKRCKAAKEAYYGTGKGWRADIRVEHQGWCV